MTSYRLDASYPSSYSERQVMDPALEMTATHEWAEDFTRFLEGRCESRGLTSVEVRWMLIVLAPIVAA